MINLPRGASGPWIHIIFQLYTLLSSCFFGWSSSIYERLYLHKWLLEKALFWVVVLILGFLLPMADSSSASYIHMVIRFYDSRTPYALFFTKNRWMILFVFYLYLISLDHAFIYIYICTGAPHDREMFNLQHEQRRVRGSSL